MIRRRRRMIPPRTGLRKTILRVIRHLAAAGTSGVCPTEFVTCDNGIATSVGNVTYNYGNVTCQDACNGMCCRGNGDGLDKSCEGFTGRVCKDGMSCIDNRTVGDIRKKACWQAKIDEVVYGCNGRQACERAGRAGHLGRVVNSCFGGDNSCFEVAYNNGSVKEIVDSCKGGQKSCEYLATDGGNITSITNGSCVEEDSCREAARVGGSIGYINHGCRGRQSCRSAARGGSIDGISYACNSLTACRDLANGLEGYNSVYSPVVSCCNEEEECLGGIVNASGLPVTCEGITASPTSSPTTEPTGSPTTASPSTASPSASPITDPPTGIPTTASPSTSSPSASPITDPPTGSPITSTPTSSPSTPLPSSPATAGPSALATESPVGVSFGKSGKSSAVPGVSKASKKSEASSKASKSVSVKSAKAEPQENAELIDEEEESVLAKLLGWGW